MASPCVASPDRVALPDLAATERWARFLGRHLQAGDVVTLQGNLGSGKTTFARAILQSYGVKGDIPSPTYTLLQTYETDHGLVVHMDLYRLKSALELDEIGWEDALHDGIALIEWPERAEVYLPEDRLNILFSIDQDLGRSSLWTGEGLWRDRLAKLLKERPHE